MSISLEDNFHDIIAKAMRGLQLTDGDVSARTGIAALEIQRLREGQFNEIAARKIAPLLGLDADALAAAGRKTWAPQPVEVEGLAAFTTPFEDMTVNSYLVWDATTSEAAVFDTGADCSEMLELIGRNKLTVEFIFLTHTHGDHIFDLDRLVEKTGAVVYVSGEELIDGARALGEGSDFRLGRLLISTRSTWGHSRGGISYLIDGLALPVAIVGDSIFAGSMGGGNVSYADALKNNREKILTLPPETVICPGHGPLTTVGEEKKHNPFFAATAVA